MLSCHIAVWLLLQVWKCTTSLLASHQFKSYRGNKLSLLQRVQSVCVCQSIAALYPDLVKELDPESIPELDPNSMGPCSSRSASWVYAAHGSWVAQIGARVKGSGCPACALSARRDPRMRCGLLKHESPDIVAQLHPTLSGNLDALDRITCGIGIAEWWLCKEDKNRPEGCQREHAWQAEVYDRCHKVRPTGCPYCSGRQVCRCNSISKLNPELLQFRDYGRNFTIKPDNIGLSSNPKVWWHHECCATDEEHVW